MRSVIENIEIIRKHKGIKKKEMAEQLDMTCMSYSRLSLGSTKLDADMLPVFARILSIKDINIFFNDALTDSVITGSEITDFVS